MNKNHEEFWFFLNRELLDLIKDLEDILQLPSYHDDCEDTWQWCESDKRRYNIIKKAMQYYDDETLKLRFGSDYLENSDKNCINEKSNDLYFDIYREHNKGVGKYESPVILIIEKFPVDYTIEEINLMGKQICDILKVDVFFGVVEWRRDKSNGYKTNYEYNTSITFRYQKDNNVNNLKLSTKTKI